ncbi:MAG: sugar transporter sugar binding protein, partial [uncultured Sphingomonas sp.]
EADARRHTGRAGARQLRAGGRPHAPLPAALLRRMRCGIWRHHGRVQGGRRVRDHDCHDQRLHERKSRRPRRRQCRCLAWLSAAHCPGRRARSAGPRDNAQRRHLRLCAQRAARTGRRVSATGRHQPRRLHRRDSCRRDNRRPCVRSAVGHARRAVPRQHRLVPESGSDARRQAGAADLGGRADRAGAAVPAAHRQALPDPEQRRRHRLRRAQPVHLHDGAWVALVPDAAEHRVGDTEGRICRQLLPPHQCRAAGHAQHGHPSRNCRVHERRRRHLSNRNMDDRLFRNRRENAWPAAVQKLCRLPLSAPVGRACRVRQRPRLGGPNPRAQRQAARGDRPLLQVHGGAQFRLGAHRPYSRVQVGARRPAVYRAAAPPRHCTAGNARAPAAELRTAAECDRGDGRRRHGRGVHRAEAGAAGPARCGAPRERIARATRV